MKSRCASVRIESGLNRVDRAVQLLEDEWRRHGDVHLESFWAEQNRTGAVGSFDSVGMLVEIVKADLRRRFDAGQRPTAAEYLARFPELVAGRRQSAERGVRRILPVRGMRRRRRRRVVLRPISGLEKLTGLAARVPPDDQPGGRGGHAPFPSFRRPAKASRNFNSSLGLARGNLPRLPGEGPVARAVNTSP